MNEKNDIIEKAVLVGVVNQEQTKEHVHEYLDELEFLAETAGVEPIKRFIQNVDNPNPKFYVGKGKLEEILNFITDNEISLVIFDDELSPTQLRNIENLLKVKILDRTNLILDIFAQRARTAHAKTQVELAQYEYLLPRLKRMWTHLERQRGGIGMRGPGEAQIETDRRIILDKIAKLKIDLVKIDKQMFQQRKNRAQMVRVALVGYTNVGKSTIMNMLSKSDVYAEDKLFATLDTTVRKVVINNLPFLLSDTVGFIRKLPHKLIESFKSTLDETRESDLIIHVVDISHPSFEEQMDVVDQTLKELKVNDKPRLVVFNKIDKFSFVKKDEDDLSPKIKQNYSLADFKNLYVANNNFPCVFISAKLKDNVEELREMLFNIARKIHFERYPYNTI
ncbi:MAG: GTPase HflX [Bacteroidales bacterium]|jgi:GTP-binding protein HflX|nr:GTPase HflX [Bacteroidales bacterium]MDY0140823.1 GTPase HflX [Bacteroidales bacterium]